MTEMRFISEASSDSTGPLALEREEVLKRAVAKVVVLGQQVGVSADQMIVLLEAGLTVRELLEYLVNRWAIVVEGR